VVTKKKEQKGSGDFSIRPAINEDHGFIRQISGEIFSMFGDYGEIIPQWFVNPDVVTVMCLEKGCPLGFAMLSISSGEILAIAVSPETQRRGIGTALLNRVEGTARQRGIKRVQLHAASENKAACMFFQNAAYTVIGGRERYYPNGQKALIMAKEIQVKGD
jgi:ribosomal protein S18 acetylase RimI-like enzyme